MKVFLDGNTLAEDWIDNQWRFLSITARNRKLFKPTYFHQDGRIKVNKLPDIWHELVKSPVVPFQ